MWRELRCVTETGCKFLIVFGPWFSLWESHKSAGEETKRCEINVHEGYVCFPWSEILGDFHRIALRQKGPSQQTGNTKVIHLVNSPCLHASSQLSPSWKPKVTTACFFHWVFHWVLITIACWSGMQWSVIHFLFLCSNWKMEIKLDNNSHVFSMDTLRDPTCSSTVLLSGLQLRDVQGRGVGNLDKVDFRSLFFLDYGDQSNH